MKNEFNMNERTKPISSTAEMRTSSDFGGWRRCRRRPPRKFASFLTVFEDFEALLSRFPPPASSYFFPESPAEGSQQEFNQIKENSSSKSHYGGHWREERVKSTSLSLSPCGR